MADMEKIQSIGEFMGKLQKAGFNGEFTVNLQSGQIQICRTWQEVPPKEPLRRLKKLMDGKFYGKMVLKYQDGKIRACVEEETLKPEMMNKV